MNIFVLDLDAIVAAQMHCDKHVPKMVVEAAQMMASALRRHGATDEQMPLTKAGKPYKGGYAHHPCTVWAGDSWANLKWLCLHGMELTIEYSRRFNKIHACEDPILRMASLAKRMCRALDMPHDEDAMTPFALAMPDEYRPRGSSDDVLYMEAEGDDAVKAYRAYYHSKQFAKWEKGTPAPDWWRGVEVTA